MDLPRDVAAIRLDNALLLFDEFVRQTVRQPDANALRGLERRFAERLEIQPSYWSQIKGRSRQIGERLARQFELNCGKPAGWMDSAHSPSPGPSAMGRQLPPGDGGEPAAAGTSEAESAPSEPRDEDERFIVGLVLTYYRRHPQRARNRLLDLLGEVLVPSAAPSAANASASALPPPAPALAPGVRRPPPAPPAPAPVDDPMALWLRSQTGVAPLRNKKR